MDSRHDVTPTPTPALSGGWQGAVQCHLMPVGCFVVLAASRRSSPSVAHGVGEVASHNLERIVRENCGATLLLRYGTSARVGFALFVSFPPWSVIVCATVRCATWRMWHLDALINNARFGFNHWWNTTPSTYKIFWALL